MKKEYEYDVTDIYEIFTGVVLTEQQMDDAWLRKQMLKLDCGPKHVVPKLKRKTSELFDSWLEREYEKK